MSDTSQEHLARRLDRLERENQRLKRLGALALIGLAALVIMGQATSAPVANTIEAERFVLRDASGHARASLGVRPDGTAALALADDTHQERAVFTVTAQGLAAVELSERWKLPVLAGITRRDDALVANGLPKMGDLTARAFAFLRILALHVVPRQQQPGFRSGLLFRRPTRAPRRPDSSR